jgi:histidinol phosphatase-like PHP family hydrolase
MVPFGDINAVVGGLLSDLAWVQPSRHQMFGYKRAARAILSLEASLATLWNAAEPPKIYGVGPASLRVMREVLTTGQSPTVERTIDESGQRQDIERRRALRQQFLSRAKVLEVLREPRLAGPALGDYHGDLQMHSEWSDGEPSIAELATACRRRGYSFAAVTDHSYGLKIAGGMSMADAGEQWEAIDRVNATIGGEFRLIRGVEANIGVDGSIDLTDAEARSFELVLAAPHSRLRRSEDQTARFLAAVEHPAVRVLAHPRGRMYGSRAGAIADWDRVFAVAAERGVAIEIDGDPARQDLDHTLAGQALAKGCLFALDSDAHTTDQLVYAETALAHARLAGIPPDRIVNCWGLERLLAWLATPNRMMSYDVPPRPP